MGGASVTRKLAAILEADMVGFSRLIGADEAGTIARQKAHRRELIDPKIAEHKGRIVKTTGDGLLVEFSSAVDAVLCAVEIQRAITAREADVPKERRIAYRCGINLGEIVIDGDDILGDGVNVAARLEALAEPGGIRISDTVFKNVKGKLDLGFADLGPQKVKNIAEPVPTYRVLLDPADVGKLVKAKPIRLAGWRWPALAAAVVLMLSLASVTWWRSWVPEVEPASMERMAFPLPDRPSIAVLPFANLTGDPKQDYVADGMTETLISTLSKIPELFIISRNSSFTYKGKAVKVQQVAEELGVKYVLEGSLQQAAENIRITVQLIDAVKGNHLWSESYDRKFEDLFKLQD
jgi:adenylate cyclase